MRDKKPKLGQHFLVDDAARHRIVDALGDISASSVLEIGPGGGALTGILAGRAGHLTCVETDGSLLQSLNGRYAANGNVEIVHADILQADLDLLLPPDGNGLIVGNLPYYITSPILLLLCAHAERLRIAVVMMQREVAERVAASPGSREYGLLSVTVQMHAEVAELFTLPPQAFAPPPEVHSTVLRLCFRPRFSELGIHDRAAFNRFLRTAFAQKRKTLLNNLRAGGFSAAAVVQAMQNLQLSLASRSEELGVQSLAALFLNLSLTKS